MRIKIMMDSFKRFDRVRQLLLIAIFAVPMGARAFTINMGGLKLSLFRMAFFGATVLFVLKRDRNRRILPSDSKTRYSVMLMVVWLLWASIAIIWAIDADNYARLLYFLLIGTAAAIIFVNVFTSREEIQYAFKALNCGIFIQSAIGWHEVVTRNYLFIRMTSWKAKRYMEGPERMPIAMCGNKNDFATLMFCGIFIALICAGFVRRKSKKLLYYMMAADYTALLFLGKSRANILGLLLALMFLLVYGRKKKIITVLSVVAVLLFIPKAIIILYGMVKETVVNKINFVRLTLILNGLDFLLNTYGFGVGNGQIEICMKRYAVYPTWGIYNMHNWWMEIMTAYGVYFFIAYLIFYLSLFFTFFKKTDAKENGPERTSLMLCAFMAGFVVASTSSSSNMSVEWIWIFWAICIAYQGILSREEEDISILKKIKIKLHEAEDYIDKLLVRAEQYCRRGAPHKMGRHTGGKRL